MSRSTDNLGDAIIKHTEERIREWADHTLSQQSATTYEQKSEFWKTFWDEGFPEYSLLEDLFLLAHQINSTLQERPTLIEKCAWCENNGTIPPTISPSGGWILYEDIIFTGETHRGQESPRLSLKQKRILTVKNCLSDLSSLLKTALTILVKVNVSIHWILNILCEKIANLMCSLPKLGSPLHQTLHELGRILSKLRSALRGDLNWKKLQSHDMRQKSFESEEFWQRILEPQTPPQKQEVPEKNQPIFSNRILEPYPA